MQSKWHNTSWADQAVENPQKCIPGLKKAENHFLRKHLEMWFFCMKTSFFGIFRFLKMWKNIFRIFREISAGAARSGPGRKCRKWRGRPLFYKQNSRIRTVKNLFWAGPELIKGGSVQRLFEKGAGCLAVWVFIYFQKCCISCNIGVLGSYHTKGLANRYRQVR